MANVTEIFDDFSPGIADDPRSPQKNSYQIVTNANVLSHSRRVIPYRSTESGDSAAATSKKQNFVVAYWTPTTTYRLFALGVVSGTAKAEVLMKDLSTTSNDLSDSGWLSPANNQSSAGATSLDLFLYYKKTGKIYGARANTALWAFDTTGGAWDDSIQALSYTNIAQGLVHSRNDIAFVPYDNKIAKNDNGTWTTTALTLPSYLYITSICEAGNYLAIAAAPLSGVGTSTVFLWDMTSDSWYEQYDFGDGVLKVIDQVDGVLIGISQSGGYTFRFTDRIIFRALSGTSAVKFKELIGASSLLNITKQKIDNRLYFQLSMTLNGTSRQGVWSVGRIPSGAFSVLHEHTPNNDTPVDSLKGFFFVGDVLLQSYETGGTYSLSKTNDSATYAHTSAIETTVRNLGDSSIKKKLVGIAATYEALPAGATVTYKYKKDGDTSWTTVGSDATTASLSHASINIESTGAALPEYNDIAFRVEMTGGAVLTSFSYEAQPLNKRPF